MQLPVIRMIAGRQRKRERSYIRTMTGAMYAAISGLKAHMSKLNVIGNNIANVNTYSYKTQSALFSDAIYTTMSGGSNGTSTSGAVNPSQIGYGTTMSSVGLDMSSGTYSPTGRDMDCMIMGDGFFLVGNKEVDIDANDASSLSALTLTRVGRFEFKADGYLSDSSGNVVYGFLCTGTDTDGNPLYSDQLVPICYPRYDATTGEIKFPAVDTTGKLTAATNQNAAQGASAEYPFAEFESVKIDAKTGMITGTSKDTQKIVTIGVIALGSVTNPNGVTHTGGAYYQAGDGSGDLRISLLGGIEKEMKISNDGGVTGATDFTYINASQANAGGGTGATTQPDGMRIYSAGGTTLETGGLEASKTDLATEISEMITTQRGYQANTRIITVTDSMLEELVNIKR